MNTSVRTSQSGFTIVELLFVAACVGLLFAVVQPSLQSAQQLSQNTTCLDRLRAIGQASAIYSNLDPNNMAIPVHPAQSDSKYFERGRFVGAYDWGGKSGIGWQDFLGGANVSIFSAYGTLAGFGPASRPLNAIIYKGGFTNHAPDVTEGQYDRVGSYYDTLLNLDAFRCPADEGPPGGAHCQDWLDHPGRSSFDHFGTSFAANLFMVGNAGGGLMHSNSPYLRPLSDIQNPGRTIMYEENIGRWAWAAKSEIPACDNVVGPGVDPGPTKAVRGWHGKNWTFNRVFADAHAETQPVYIEGTENQDGYAQHYFNEYIEGLPQWPGGPPSNNEELNQRYRCIIIRGDGWQKDTFPAELIPTGLPYSGSGRPSYENCVEASEDLRRMGAQLK